MLLHPFHHFAADKKLKLSRYENQTSEGGKSCGYANSPMPLTTKAQLAGRGADNGDKGMCSSSQLPDNANDIYEALSALSPGTKRSPHDKALWTDEEQYESLDGVWNQKTCDKENGKKETEMGSYLASNEVWSKRDENYEEAVALEKDLNDYLIGNDKEWTMSDPVYEETNPSRLSGLSAAECQSRGKSCSDYINSEADHQESKKSYVNARSPLDNKKNMYTHEENVCVNDKSASSTFPNVYVNNENVYNNDHEHGNDKTSQYVNAKPSCSSSAVFCGETMEDANIYDNEKGTTMSAQDQGMSSNKPVAPEETYNCISS